MKKCLVLYSGGLDSRLVIKLMQKKGFKVTALHFILPFNNTYSVDDFCKIQNCELITKDCRRGDLLKEYLDIIVNQKYGTGKGVNPCVDCKIWMFLTAKKFADKNNIRTIVSGEVLGQRPMSQIKSKRDLIDKQIEFEVLRPLDEFGCEGRQRIMQRKLAKEFQIKYPNPGGGCLLCEKILKKRFKFLFDNNLINGETLKLSKIGRHFIIDNNWFVVGRDEKEGEIIEKFKNHLSGDHGTPDVYFNKRGCENVAKKLQEAYKNKNTLSFQKYKL